MGRKRKDKSDLMIPMSVKVPQELDRKLKALKASKKRFNMSEFIRLAIEEYLENGKNHEK